MVTQTFDISDYNLVGDLQTHSAQRLRADDDCLGYRLDVVAASALDVIQGAGGWLFDRVMAGWQVNVLLPPGSTTRNNRPLRILGVRVVDQGLDAAGAVSRGLAVSAEAFAADERVRERVLEALEHHSTEVALWGDGWPLRIDRGVTRVQYVLSAAARVFKGHALEAAGIGCDSIGPIETLLSDTARLG